jgi:hypothetical protein
MNIRIILEDTDLASRSAARQLRHTILQTLGERPSIQLDLSAVQSISDSYADELFGVLCAQLGFDSFFTKVKIIGSNDSLNRAIAINIDNRTRNLVAA